MDHVSISNRTLFLRPLIFNFLSTTVPIFFATGCLSFLEEDYKNIVEFQTEWIRILKIWRAREFNPEKIVVGRYYVALGPLYVSSYTWQRIKSIFAIIELIGNIGDSILCYPSLKCLSKAFLLGGLLRFEKNFFEK